VPIGCDSTDEARENAESVRSDNHMNYTTADLSDVNVKCDLNVRMDGKNVIAEVTFTSLSKGVVPIWKRNLLMEEELTWVPFKVTRQGAEVPYTGRMIKRGPPRADEYYELEANTSVGARVTLNDYYSVSVPGEYSIQYVSFNVIPGTEKAFLIESNCVRFVIDN
jgi:hypothetical protein